MRPAKGKAIMLVRRKCFGNEWKYIHASGPVVSWQDMDMAAEFHIRRRGFLLCEGPLSGQKPLSHGKTNAMPPIAAYDSWNPGSDTDAGETVSCMVNAARRTERVLLYLPASLAHSPNVMNISALAIDGPAPVASV